MPVGCSEIALALAIAEDELTVDWPYMRSSSNEPSMANHHASVMMKQQ
jgi:hypothetical protein